MRRSSQLLPGDIHRRTKLTSAVYGIQPFPQQQCARIGQCISTAYCRRDMEEHREGVPKGEWRTNRRSFVNAISVPQNCAELIYSLQFTVYSSNLPEIKKKLNKN